MVHLETNLNLKATGFTSKKSLLLPIAVRHCIKFINYLGLDRLDPKKIVLSKTFKIVLLERLLPKKPFIKIRFFG